MVPSLVVAMCQGEAGFATATISSDPIRGPAEVAQTSLLAPDMTIVVEAGIWCRRV